MKVFFFLLCIPIFAHSKECFLYEVIGKPKINKKITEFIIAGGTQSQVILQVSIKTQTKLFPYLDTTTQAEVILSGPVNEYPKLLEINSLKNTVSDPLNAGKSNAPTMKGKVKCP